MSASDFKTVLKFVLVVVGMLLAAPWIMGGVVRYMNWAGGVAFGPGVN